MIGAAGAVMMASIAMQRMVQEKQAAEMARIEDEARGQIVTPLKGDQK